MGKMPLAGLIGACGIGMLLTGCNCCNKQNSRPSYMGGRADTPTEFTRSRPRGGSTATDLGAASSPLDSISSSATPLTPAAQGMSGSGTVGGNAGGTMMMPNNTGSAPMSGSYPSLPSSGKSGVPMSANTTSMGGNSGLTDNGAASSYGGNPLAPAPIQQVANRGEDSSTVKDAAYHAAANDAASSSGTGQMVVPPNVTPYPPPPPSSAMSGSNSSWPSSASLPPPPPPPSDGMSPLDAPPPSVNSGSSSGMSGMGAKTSTSSGSPSSLPPYLK